jgi:hypothetical protein
MPHFPDMAKGDKVEMFIHMFFGQNEIRVEVKIQHYKFTFTSTFESAEKFKVGRSLTPKK